jgi:polysaccharide export outer membrane protein
MLLIIAVLAGGCNTYDAKELQAFLREPRTEVSNVEYRVYPPDVLRIYSVHVEEINGISQQVRPDGKINLPLVGELDVVNATPKEIERRITEAASTYYQDADAVVEVAAYNSQRFYVFGQVTRPGPIAWTGRDTLLDALARAQPTLMAWPERIVLVRGTQPQLGGAMEVTESADFSRTGIEKDLDEKGRHKLTINLNAMIREGDLSRNVFLQPNDVIYVQPNPLARVGLAIQTLLFPVRPAVEAVQAPARAAASATMMP